MVGSLLNELRGEVELSMNILQTLAYKLMLQFLVRENLFGDNTWNVKKSTIVVNSYTGGVGR